MQTKRFIHYDYIRVLGVLCIISIHVSDILFVNNTNFNHRWWYGQLLQTFVRIGLPIFFMISGALILNGNINRLTTFYYKRFIKIVIPLFIYSFIYLLYSKYKWNFSSFNLLDSIASIVAQPTYPHLWFVYTILGLYLCTPFIKIMVDNLSTKMLINLIAVYILLKASYIYLPLLGINIGINSFIFDGWIIYFILGYTLTKITNHKLFNCIYALGVFSFIVTLIIQRWIPKANTNIFDLSPTMIFMASSVFLLFESNKEKINSKKYFYSIISFISRYSYSIYLIHIFTLQYIIYENLHINALYFHYTIGTPFIVFLTLLISLLIALILDNLIVNPIIKLFNFTVKYFQNVADKLK